ncbi:MAG: alpha/beta fold hydrolase [Pseudomonadota bacterium]
MDQLAQQISQQAQNAAAADPNFDSARYRQTLTAAIDAEARRRLGQFFTGVDHYRKSPQQRQLDDPPTVWQEGATRLLDYGHGDPDRPVMLVVPSLINRGYILDLTAESSLMRWLVTQGYRPLLLDWGMPGEVELGFSLTDYVAGRLERALDATRRLAGAGAVPVMGYCMGGMLAAALAWRRPVDVSRLILLATPWSFHAMGASAARRVAAAYEAIAPFVEVWRALPVDAIQSLFSSLDPLLVPRKFAKLGQLTDQGDPVAATQIADFVALEDWLNDGVPLPAAVAHECLRGWYGRNEPANGQWRIAGLAVDPTMITAETLVVIPNNDRIVPPGSALALAAHIPRATIHRVDLGHVGLIVGSQAKESVWQPMVDWLGQA